MIAFGKDLQLCFPCKDLNITIIIPTQLVFWRRLVYIKKDIANRTLMQKCWKNVSYFKAVRKCWIVIPRIDICEHPFWLVLTFVLLFFADHLRVFNTPNGIGLARIVAKSTWGILRGLQSLSQLFYRQEINSTWNQVSGLSRTVWKIMNFSVCQFLRFSKKHTSSAFLVTSKPKVFISQNFRFM